MIAPPEAAAGAFHVAGILVQAVPDAAPSIARRIRAMPGAVVHAVAGDGKLVVTLESADGAFILEQLTRLQHLSGVVSALLVSEHSEPLAAADEVLPHDLAQDPT